MTSRERVKHHLHINSRIKWQLISGGFCCSQINAQVVGELRKYYGLKRRARKILDMATMTGIIEPDLADIMMSDVQMLDPRYDAFGHTNDNWKEWSYQGETVLIPGDCELSDDGNGGYYVYPCGDTSVKPSGHMPEKWFLL